MVDLGGHAGAADRRADPAAGRRGDRAARAEKTQALQFQEQARWIRGARSPGETEARLKQVVGGLEPDGERAARFRQVAAEHEAHTGKEIAKQREQRDKREKAAFPRIPKEAEVRF